METSGLAGREDLKGNFTFVVRLLIFSLCFQLRVLISSCCFDCNASREGVRGEPLHGNGSSVLENKWLHLE